MIKYIIDIYIEKELNLECETNNKYKPIHFICDHSTPEMIKYIIDIYIEKGLNLECKTKCDYRPIDFICSHSTPEMIKYINGVYFEKGLNLCFVLVTKLFFQKTLTNICSTFSDKQTCELTKLSSNESEIIPLIDNKKTK